ncbi:MAG TPA: type II toxin-antitoxin system RelE/ParE family toxin [Longimicrobium sp.]|uniref:type II toxin-antitoxin system RelE/ParE family toxin n=1 Tax=Longimicrobium sp. TaxID=2029185 RepID=UPI002ED80DA1
MNDDVQVVPTEWFVRDVRRLSANLRARVDRRIRELGKKGWVASARSRDVAELDDGIWELRVLGQGTAFRVLFFLDPRYPGRRVVLMACVAKASMKKAHVMTSEIERAKARRAQWLPQEMTR